MPKNSYKLVNELSRSQRFRRFRKYNENNSNIISCITSSSNSDITFSNLTNTSQETSKSIPITSNSIIQCNKYNLNNLNEDLDLSDNFEFDTSYSSSGDELNDDECIHNYDNQNKLCYELQKWVLNKCIPANAVTSLLKILCSCNPSDVLTLPKDVRTLMSTPRLALVTKKVGDYGEYTHFGLESGLRNKWLKYSKTILKNVHDFQVYINFDGLPIHKSSSGSLWPISCAIIEVKDDPFVIGSYYGTKEPKDIEAYLEDYINEATHLTKNGLFLNDCQMSFSIVGYICDAPARALVKVIKRHNGYFGCEKCEVEGNYINNRMSFAEISAPHRSNDRLAAASYDDHCQGKSPLVKIPGTKLVTHFPLDCLHLIYLGAVRKILLLLTKGPLTVRLSGATVQNISHQLVKLSKTITSDFARKCRSLSELCHWKEFLVIMVSKEYVICEVQFEEGPMITILCSSWLVQPYSSPSYCLWPLKKGLSSKLIKCKCPPDSNWARYECKVLYECDNYQIARKKLKRFEEESSYCGETTNDEARGRGKRKKYKTQSFFSSDDNLSDDQIPLMKTIPNPPAWTKQNNIKSNRNLFDTNYHTTGKTLTNPEVESIHDREDVFGSNGLSNDKISINVFNPHHHSTGKTLTNLEVESIHNSEDMFGSNGLSMSNAEDNNDMSGMEHLTNTPTNTEYNYRLALNDTHCHSPAVSNNVGMTTNESELGILSKIANLMEKQLKSSHYTNCLLQDILKQNKSTLKDCSTGVQEKFRNVFNNFPLRCLSDVVEMEEKLKDSASYHLMKTRLRQCGCSANLNDSVTSMLRTLFTDECATYYNFDGKNNSKNAFKELTIYHIIIDVTLNFHKDGTEHDIKTRIRAWLRLASTRISNRQLTKNKK